MLLILFITNNRRLMRNRVNGRAANILGAITTVAVFAASAGLVLSWLLKGSS
jgi:Mn2+/Fe2+ NRAMP family transporter